MYNECMPVSGGRPQLSNNAYGDQNFLIVVLSEAFTGGETYKATFVAQIMMV